MVVARQVVIVNVGRNEHDLHEGSSGSPINGSDVDDLTDCTCLNVGVKVDMGLEYTWAVNAND